MTFLDGTFFFETVTRTNGFDSIWLKLTEHPYPCEILFAENSTERVDDNTSIFKVSVEYKLMDGVAPEVAAGFQNQIQGLGEIMALMVKDIFDKYRLDAPVTLGDHLTIKYPADVASPEADVPSSLESVSEYNDFFTKPELYQRIHIHMIGMRAKDASPGYSDDSGGVITLNRFGMRSLISTPDPMIVAEAKGMDTGSTTDFPIGKHTFAVSDDSQSDFLTKTVTKL